MKKDRATQYWDNEIKRAAEDTAKAYAEYEQAKEEEFAAFHRHKAADNNADAETKEEARKIYRQKSFISAQKWKSWLMASKWEGITRGAAENYKKRKAVNKQEPTQSKGRRQ